jgi:hypothetical protein
MNWDDDYHDEDSKRLADREATEAAAAQSAGSAGRGRVSLEGWFDAPGELPPLPSPTRRPAIEDLDPALLRAALASCEPKSEHERVELELVERYSDLGTL